MLTPRDQPLLFVFAAVVRHESFTRASEELGVTKSVVSAQVRALEERLGVRLLERSTRRMRLTQVGERVYSSAERMVSLSADIDTLVESQRGRPVGTLRVGAQTDLGARFVTPVVAELCAAHPELHVDVYYDDREVDMLDSAIEVTVRLGVPKDSRLIAKKLASDVEVIVASPALAARWPEATRPTDLRDGPWLAHREVQPKRDAFRGPEGVRSEVTIPARRATASTVSALVDLAKAGVGFVVLPEILVDAALIDGSLVRVLSGWRRRKLGVYAVRPSRAHTPVRVTLFVQAITRAFSRRASL